MGIGTWVMVVPAAGIVIALSTRLSGLPAFPLALAICCVVAAIAMNRIVHAEARRALSEAERRSAGGRRE